MKNVTELPNVYDSFDGLNSKENNPIPTPERLKPIIEDKARKNRKAVANIYVTQELKAEMDKRSDVNWSAVARKAFRDKLIEVNGSSDKPQENKKEFSGDTLARNMRDYD